MSPRRDAAGVLLVGLLVLSAPRGASGQAEEKEKKENKENLDRYASPLVVEASPFSSFAVSALPRTTVWGQLGALYGKTKVGRARYEQVSGQVGVGFTWSPKLFDHRFGLGAKLDALQLNALHTHVPPAIDEWETFVDLSEFNLFAEFVALRKAVSGLSTLLVTPFLRLHLPTDTSRLRLSRHIPIKKILGGEAAEGPPVLVEPGLAFGVTVGPATFYASTGLALGALAGECFLLLWNLNVGAAVKVPLVVLIVETGGVIVHHKRHDSVQWQVSPGLRFEHKSFKVELSARFGLSEFSRIPYGIFTVGFALHWCRPAG